MKMFIALTSQQLDNDLGAEGRGPRAGAKGRGNPRPIDSSNTSTNSGQTSTTNEQVNGQTSITGGQTSTTSNQTIRASNTSDKDQVIIITPY